jgi:hypothetical protein
METQRLLFVWLVTAVLTIFCGACEAQQLTCETGPVTKTYGGTNWLIYSCSDHQSLALLSEPNSLASPMFFFIGWMTVSTGFLARAPAIGQLRTPR